MLWSSVDSLVYQIRVSTVVLMYILLFSHVVPKALHTLRYGKGEGIILANFGCKGNELQLRDCPYYGGRRLNCGHHQDAGVFCSDGQSLCLHNNTSICPH